MKEPNLSETYVYELVQEITERLAKPGWEVQSAETTIRNDLSGGKRAKSTAFIWFQDGTFISISSEKAVT